MLPLVLGTSSVACISDPALAGSRAPEMTIADTYTRVSKSVATIETKGVDAPVMPGGRPTMVEGIGSGVLVSNDGLVLTAAHVIQTADEIRVSFEGLEAIPARVVRSNPAADVAVIKLERMPEDVQIASLGDSDKVRVGEEVFVVGAPLGITHTLTVGHISARRQPNELMTLSNAELFQTDAPINQGNSGGPMFNAKGEVVGIVSHMISVTGGNQGLGFSVTSNAAQALMSEPGVVWSGLNMLRLSGGLARLFNVPQSDGLLVQQVAKNSLGDRLGLRGGDVRLEVAEYPIIAGGDIILAVGGNLIGSNEDTREKVREYMATLKPGDLLSVKVLRGGDIVELKTALTAEDLGR